MRILATAPAVLGFAPSGTHPRVRTVPDLLAYAVTLFGLAWYRATEGLLGSGISLARPAVDFGSVWVFPLLGGVGDYAVYFSAAAGMLIGFGLVVQASIRTPLPGGIGAAGSVYRRAWRIRKWRSGMSQGDFIRYASAIVGGVRRTLWAK